MRERRQHEGFTLLEMMVSLAVMLVVSGAAFTALDQSQKVYGSQELTADMHASLRSAFELMAQEVGQAGSLSFTPTTLSAAVSASGTAQTVTLGSSANIFVNEELTVDTGSNLEVVQVTALPGTNQVKGIFTLAHASGAPVTAQGAFPNGILAPTTASSNTLQIFGDINGNNTLAFVEYDCSPGTASAPGTLTRSITTLAPGVASKTASQVLLNNLIGSGTNCFTPTMGAGGSVTAGNCTVGSSTFTCVTDMQITLTVQTSQKDPQTQQFPYETKNFLNISSRNVFCAYIIATSSSPTATLLQPTPTGLPLS